MKKLLSLIALLLALALCLSSCDILAELGIEIDIPGLEDINGTDPGSSDDTDSPNIPSVSLDEIPEFTDSPYVIINDNIPFFTAEEIVSESYETYYDKDGLDRCTLVIACIGKDLMPAEGEERGSIGSVKPSGWQTIKFDIVDGKYLYNRCHLIGWQLTAENANRNNLITGTRYMNVDGMLPFENMVADYIKETENHVMYRVTPIYDGNNLVARGVLMEAYSVEDEGEGICYCVYVYNNQPGVVINYANGEAVLAE